MAAISERQAADDRAHVGRDRRQLEERVHARDQVDARRHHGGGVDQGGDRRRALHGVREPGVERDLGGLGERADQQQQAAGDDVAVAALDVGGARERAEEVERADLLEDEVGPEHEADVADHVDHERLDARARRRLAPVPERDQQVGGRADERPADDQEEEVPGQDEQQHAEHEEVQVREEARVAAVRRHVGHGVEVDQRRDARDDERHVDRQRVEQQRELRVDAHGVGVVPRHGHDLALLVAEVLQREQRAERRQERERDRERADVAVRLRRQQPEAQADEDRPREREQQDHPAVGLQAHPCSSRSSSTSIGSRRR